MTGFFCFYDQERYTWAFLRSLFLLEPLALSQLDGGLQSSNNGTIRAER